MGVGIRYGDVPPDVVNRASPLLVSGSARCWQCCPRAGCFTDLISLESEPGALIDSGLQVPETRAICSVSVTAAIHVTGRLRKRGTAEIRLSITTRIVAFDDCWTAT